MPRKKTSNRVEASKRVESDTATSKKAAEPQRFRDRIRELRRVKAAELKRNPKNFRIHDLRQRNAMEAMLEEVGWAGCAVAYEDGGALVLLDGHLRADIADDEDVPVLVTDLKRAEAEKLLAGYDALGGLAALDGAAFEALLADLQFDSRDLEAALDDVARAQLSTAAPPSGKERRIQAPSQKLLPHEHYDYVLVLARSRTTWARLSAALDLEETRKPRSKRVGIGRCVDAESLLRLLEKAEKGE